LQHTGECNPVSVTQVPCQLGQACLSVRLIRAGNDKVGEGRMTLTESHPSDLVKIKVDFVKPFEGTNTSEFTFKPQGDQTAVTWSMAGHNNFVAKALCLFMNMDRMIGRDMENGLAQLKSVVEAAVKK